MALLCVAGFAVLSGALSLVTLNKIKDHVIATSLSGQSIRLSNLVDLLSVSDVVLIVATTGTAILLGLLEFRHHGLRRLLTTASDPEAWVLLTVLVAWLATPT